MALDPGESSGFAVLDLAPPRATVVAYGSFNVDTSSPFLGDWCLSFNARVAEAYAAHAPIDTVGIEDYYFSKRTCSGAIVNAAYRAAAYMWCRERGIPYVTLGISAWKVFVTGRVTPTPQQKKLWGAAPAQKLATVDALWRRHGIRLHEYSVSEKTGKPIAFRFDESDAVAQGVYLAHAVEPRAVEFSCVVAPRTAASVGRAPKYDCDAPPDFSTVDAPARRAGTAAKTAGRNPSAKLRGGGAAGSRCAK